MFDASRILAAEESFALPRISKIVRTGHGCVEALLPLIVHEDNHQLVIYKPAGYLSQKDSTGDFSVNEIFAAYLREKYDKPGNVFCAAVHRLDRPAQGLMVLARTSKAARRISNEIRAGHFEKRYRTLTAKPLLARGRIAEKIVLSADMQKIHRMARRVTRDNSSTENLPAGQRYLLSARLVSESHGIFQYDVTIEGGKFHQIRALFAAAGSPLIGDVKYGGRPLPQKRDRIGLVAHFLCYQHPTQEKRQLFALNENNLQDLPRYFI